MIDELRTLIEISRSGTFAGAGHRLGLTQSAVSGHMKRLEEMLGFKLFDRSGRSAVLNAAGLRVMGRAHELTQLFDGLKEERKDEAAEAIIRIGAIESVQPTLLARALVSVRGRYPRLRVRITPGLSIYLFDLLDAGELDLVIAIQPPFGLPIELSWVPLVREAYVLVVPTTIEGTDWREIIRSQPFLRYDRSSYGGRQVDRFLSRQRLDVLDSIELDDVEAMIHMVEAGLGVALVPLAERHLPLSPGLRVVPLAEETFYREIGIIQHREKLKKPEVSFLSSSLVSAIEV